MLVADMSLCLVSVVCVYFLAKNNFAILHKVQYSDKKKIAAELAVFGNFFVLVSFRSFLYFPEGAVKAQHATRVPLCAKPNLDDISIIRSRHFYEHCKKAIRKDSKSITNKIISHTQHIE